ncbi:MAG: hypothetical protein LBP94_04325 [Zoogloeaceae bacterium]|jgi:hypothetical protein|nr:hypothetical protein [Zoogloeaceae bacterium]
MTRIGFLLAALLAAPIAAAQTGAGTPPATNQPAAEKPRAEHRDKAQKALKAIKGDEDKNKGSASGDQKAGR